MLSLGEVRAKVALTLSIPEGGGSVAIAVTLLSLGTLAGFLVIGLATRMPARKGELFTLLGIVLMLSGLLSLGFFIFE